MPSFQPNTLQGANTTYYSLIFNPAANVVEFACRSGEYWVRPSAATSSTLIPASGVLAGYNATTGANTNGANPVTSPLTKGWIRMLPGDDVNFGDTLSDPITQCDIWCVSAGDLIVTEH